ncbi:MAG TPA: pyrroline-5-carboxylate reductase dimerization domain-containing protein, partial [Mobilitalea sp.]|nr:pyrroline-5-carboxylate reductase dimerization domain-containing protein [Mobilitalea sp.]
SPGGTTIAAVKALEEHGFRNAIMKATEACFNRAEKLTLKN